MENIGLCAVYAPVINIAVAILKRIPFVKRNPKVIAFALSLALNVIGTGLIKGVPASIPELVACVLSSFTGSVALHEVVTDRKHGLLGNVVM